MSHLVTRFLVWRRFGKCGGTHSRGAACSISHRDSLWSWCERPRFWSSKEDLLLQTATFYWSCDSACDFSCRGFAACLAWQRLTNKTNIWTSLYSFLARPTHLYFASQFWTYRPCSDSRHWFCWCALAAQLNSTKAYTCRWQADSSSFSKSI